MFVLKGVRFYVNVKSVHALDPKRSYNSDFKAHLRQFPLTQTNGNPVHSLFRLWGKDLMWCVPPLDVRASVGSQWVVGVEKICSSKVSENLAQFLGGKFQTNIGNETT